MSKSKKEASADAVPQAILGSNNTTQPNRSSLIGKTVSLNQKVETFFGIGTMWLSPENYYCEIPEGLEDQELDIISKSLSDGILVEGKQFIPPIDRDKSVLEEYWNVLKDAGFNINSEKGRTARSKYTMLYKKGSDRGWTAYEIASYSLNKETQSKGREEVLRILKELIDNHQGEKTFYKEPIN